MDLFNRKRAKELEETLQYARKYYQSIIDRMDEEMFKVAKGRYLNKYLKIEDGDLFALFHVSGIECYQGMISLFTYKLVEITNVGIKFYTPSEQIECFTESLSELKNKCIIIKASEFYKYANQCKDQA